jgi:segregation and condensation protein B
MSEDLREERGGEQLESEEASALDELLADGEDAAEGHQTEEGQDGPAEEAETDAEQGAADDAGGEQEDDGELKRIVEALLFSSDRPVTTRRLAEMSGARDGRQVRGLIRRLSREYDEQGRAFRVEEIAGGFQLLTRAEYGPWISRLHSRQQSDSLSKAALETLAIVAYRQPITRAEVDDIRGVQCGPMLRALVDRRLAKVVGRSEELGRPLLYGTTKRFLEVFGLKSLSELPKRSEFAAARPKEKPEQPSEEPPPASEQGPEGEAPAEGEAAE